MRERSKAVAALALGTIVVAFSFLSATADENDSAFAATDAAGTALVAEAQAQDLETFRLLSGPRAFAASGDHAPEQTLLVIIKPERPFHEGDVREIQAFLAKGGSVLVADNFGHANSVTEAFGITFERVRLVDNAESVDATLSGRVFEIHTSAPTALHLAPGLDARVLARSSTDSFLDRDGDGLVNAWEPPGPFPLLVEADVGSQGGRIMALADPTLLTELPGEPAGNSALRAAILARLLPEGGAVVVDESRSPSADPWLVSAAAIVGVTTSDPWRYAVATLAVLLLGLGALLALNAWGPHRFSVDRFVRRSELEQAAIADAEGRGDGPAPSGPEVQWTRRGRAALAGGIVLAVVGLTLGNQQATYAASFLLLGGALAMWTAPVRVRAQRGLGVERIHEEGETPVEVTFEAAGRRGGHVEILDALPQEFKLVDGHNWVQAALRPKRPVALRYQVRAILRGPYTVGPLRLRTSDPFQLRAVEQTADTPREVVVLPRLDPLTRIPFKSRIPMLTLGPHLVNRAGDGTEFHALRDYQTGDSIRIVNWKASARSKDLVVNQRVHESMSTITVFLDARSITEAGTVRTNPLNEGCRAALSIVVGALQARDKVRVFVYGDGVRELCPDARRSKRHEMSAALARLCAEGKTTFKEAVDGVLPELRPNNPVVLVSGLEADDTVVEGLQLLHQRSILPFVLALEIGTEPEEGGSPEPGAHRLRTERKNAIAQIQSTGTPVLPAVPGMPLGALMRVGLR